MRRRDEEEAVREQLKQDHQRKIEIEQLVTTRAREDEERRKREEADDRQTRHIERLAFYGSRSRR
jgi:hypothetical protein